MTAGLFDGIEQEPTPRFGRDAPWMRQAWLMLFAAFLIAVLAGAIGQAAVRSTATGDAAELTLSAPHTLRGGLLYQARVEIHARRPIAEPRLVLGRGWLEEMQVNSIQPQPSQESGADHEVVLSYDALRAGSTLTVWLQFQVNPTGAGRRPADVRLRDGARTLATIERTVTVLP